ncbi:YbaK/EbsC family protein [Amorphus coralli]|uniref:YbaK/EbsC family protein n=1 Tax=Amorphus coralli TaxID=340680 RepID=UPI00036FD75C|nr:YbaK/EbsC family protein [Amorphus coralli]
MSETVLPDSARRVADAAEAAGLAITVREMPASTRTAEEAAASCGTGVGQIVKSLVFRGKESGRAYLLLVSGENRVNEKAVGREIGEKLERPDARYVRETTGYAIGGIPPIGHAAQLPVFMDAALLAYDEVWAAAGTPQAVFAVDPKALRTATNATVLSMAG